MEKLNLILGFHNHQPIGNLDFVIEDAVDRAYLPFLNEIEQAALPISLHYTGALLDWLEKHRPEIIEKIATIRKRGNIEIMGGAFYEPILTVLRDYDKYGQISKMSQYIKQNFDYDVSGFWLAERIWEPHLAAVLNKSNIKYVVVDDSHFKIIGMPEESLYNYYETEDQGKEIYIFPISQKMRYLIPFAPPEETISFLKNIYDKKMGKVVVMADDGEKFGIWPGTYDLVYKKKWLSQFFEILKENSDWLQVTTFDRVIKELKPAGNVYLPTASYTEMMEWALPSDKQYLFEKIYNDPNVNQEAKLFMRGGFWRNFFMKYSESNLMHKKGTDISARIEKLIAEYGENELLLNARDELWRAQTNCPYWHGVFGGLYLPHIRDAVFQHLINAQNLIEQFNPVRSIFVENSDFLKTGDNILRINTSTQQLFINLMQTGAVVEHDFKERSVNITNVLTRRFESYHNKLKKAAANQDKSENSAKTIHDIIAFKEPNLQDKLIYDKLPRYSVREFLCESTPTVEALYKRKLAEECAVNEEVTAYDVQHNTDNVEVLLHSKEIPFNKKYKISADIPRLDIEYTDITKGKILLTELNLSLLTGQKDFSYAVIDKDTTIDVSMQAEGDFEQIEITDKIRKYKITIRAALRSKFAMYPIETVSNSEAGFERVFQGLCLNLMSGKETIKYSLILDPL